MVSDMREVERSGRVLLYRTLTHAVMVCSHCGDQRYQSPHLPAVLPGMHVSNVCIQCSELWNVFYKCLGNFQEPSNISILAQKLSADDKNIQTNCKFSIHPNALFQAQHVPTGMYKCEGCKLPVHHPWPQAHPHEVCHREIVQWGQWWGRPAEQHAPCPISHTYGALCHEHVSRWLPFVLAHFTMPV